MAKLSNTIKSKNVKEHLLCESCQGFLFVPPHDRQIGTEID